jgi:probable HAF family extracellular repeat protein
MMTDLGITGSLFRINNSGEIIGCTAGGPSSRGFLYSDGTQIDLGFPEGSFSYPYGINEAGQIVGFAGYNYGVQRGFIYNDGVVTYFDAAGDRSSCARDINNEGQVVGEFINSSGQAQAFLYSDGTRINLNDLIDPPSGWILQDARAINDAGQIVGVGVDPEGYGHAWLLTLIPEPSVIALSALGFLFLRRSKQES